MKPFSVALFVLFAAASVFGLTPGVKPEPVKPRLIPAETAKPGQTVELKLDLEIGSEWHMFSDKPEVSGVTATQLIIDPSEGFTVDKIVYPKPTPVYSDVFDKDLNFYVDQVTISVFLKLSAKASGEIPVKGLLKFQACSNTLCLPPAKLPVSGSQKVTQ